MSRRALGLGLRALGLGLLALGLVGCTDEGEDMPHQARTGDFAITHDDKRVPVYWAAGRGLTGPQTRLLLVLHGVERNGAEYRDSLAEVVDGIDVLVVCPTFSSADFRGVQGYNLGGLVDRDGDPRPRSRWTFTALPEVVAEARRRFDVDRETFDVFGHSAGAQVVHRLVEFCPELVTGRAVAANAGWYTMLDEEVGYPFGLEDAPADVDLDRVLAADLTLLLGEDDVEEENLRTDGDANAQGETRVERGHAFYESARELAAERGTRFGWRLRTVPGVGHDHQPMAAAALEDLGLVEPSLSGAGQALVSAPSASSTAGRAG